MFQLRFPFASPISTRLVEQTAFLGKVLARCWSTMFRRRRKGAISRLCIAAWRAAVELEGTKRRPPSYCLKTTGGPLTRFALRATVTSTRSAILMKGMPLFIP